MAILEKNFELIWCYSDPFGTRTKIMVIKIFGAVHQIVFYFDNFILKKWKKKKKKMKVEIQYLLIQLNFGGPSRTAP